MPDGEIGRAYSLGLPAGVSIRIKKYHQKPPSTSMADTS